MSNLRATIPPGLREEADRYVQAGRHQDIDSLVTDALSRYLDSRSEAFAEEFIKEDIQWGRYGDD